MAAALSNEHEAEERALLLRARAGDARAQSALLARHRTGLERFCYLMLGDLSSARTAVADTALAASDCLETSLPGVSARICLYRLALRACLQAEAASTISFDADERLTE